MSVEGGIPGTQRRLVCPRCAKAFTAWRPDTQPGSKVKCYFCRFEFEDEAARRAPPAVPPAAETPAPEVPAAPETPAPAPEAPPADTPAPS